MKSKKYVLLRVKNMSDIIIPHESKSYALVRCTFINDVSSFNVL